MSADPIALFRQWQDEAAAAGAILPDAMTLATADAAGHPSARTVLLKGVDERGFVFYTNYSSRKGTELTANPSASLVFGWHPIGRQVVVAGRAERVPRHETESYFASRPRESQLGAWASPQSHPIASRKLLEGRYEQLENKYREAEFLPRPRQWGGFGVEPFLIEFWQGRPNRMHDRICYMLTDKKWVARRLAP